MNQNNYINLARKYRPNKISELIGQEALVTTLKNAFMLNKVAHAFMLTGVRGVGKTTTARIIAKALNCIGEDGSGSLTLDPCGVCENCIAITNDNHLDVIEMDAASKTGVDDIREIIENGKYRPSIARYKIFIIDEVHMLSKNAFNALLKTLEEPPPHLKFIFATTEIKKVPITVLSRCQRFDLRRVDVITLSKHLENIAKKEKVNASENALILLAKKANGSVRDALSLFDQAIVYNHEIIEEKHIAEMTGQGDRIDLYKIYEALLNKDEINSFSLSYQQYNKGVEIENMIISLLDITHQLTLLKSLNNKLNLLDLTEDELSHLQDISKLIDLPSLLKIWQILLKSIEELKVNHNHLQVFDMVIIKIINVLNFNTLESLVKIIQNNPDINTPKFIPSEQEELKKNSSENNIFKEDQTKNVNSEDVFTEILKPNLIEKNDNLEENIKTSVGKVFEDLQIKEIKN